MAPDQRYCLECGEHQMPRSSFLLAGVRSVERPEQPLTFAPAPAAAPPPGQASPQRSNTSTVLAGVGVLMLAMGVGVLVGRSGSSAQRPAPAQVVSIASSVPGVATTGAASEASFAGDWPAGTSGYTVQLQTLAQAGTPVSAVEAAKTSASAKGAKAVGALKSEEFTSLAAGRYVIYSGIDHSRGAAEKALAALRKEFPAAKVIKVANGASSPSTEGAGSSSSAKGGVGSSESKPAPPSVLESLKNVKGKSYEERSKSLPDVVSTG